MQKIRYGLIVLLMLLCSVTTASAQVSVGIGLPGVNIGINLPLLPELVPVPGYPVYYAPQVNANYFFYDGMYWVFQNDNWYASSWYNGPWGLVAAGCCAGVHPAYPRGLLPAASWVLSRVGFECAAPLGSALGPKLGAATQRMEQVGSQISSDRPVASLPAAVFRR